MNTRKYASKAYTKEDTKILRQKMGKKSKRSVRKRRQHKLNVVISLLKIGIFYHKWNCKLIFILAEGILEYLIKSDKLKSLGLCKWLHSLCLFSEQTYMQFTVTISSCMSYSKKRIWRLHVHCGSRVLKNYLGVFMKRVTILLGILWLDYHGTYAGILKASTAYIHL